MDLGLKGRVVIVSAASQGLGKAAAAAFVREGAHVVIASRDKKKLGAAAKDIASVSSGGEVLPVVTDVTKPAHIRRLVASTIRRFGRVDVLVVNAGGPPVGSFLELPDTKWQEGIDLSLMSAVRLIREVLPHMRNAGWGRVIAITSITTKQPIDDLIISSAVRPGVLGLLKVLANQHGREGILFNAVAPGLILTSRQREISEARAKGKGSSVEEYIATVGRTIPIGRLGEPDELAHVIAFLGSERASYINGATISVDGGLTKGLF
jgi:3-oxoacyl-[acyl-carrier protein] reductase